MSHHAGVLGSRNAGTTVVADRDADAIRQRLLAPTYQNRLRVIGRHLDMNGFRWINLVEVEGGLLVRAFDRGSSQSELLEFPDNAFPRMMEDALSARGLGEHFIARSELTPTGYEDILRAIGFQLDRRVAKMIAVSECRTVMFVSGLQYQETSTGSGYVQFDFMLTPEQVRAALDAAFRRRGADLSATPPAGH
jgi:hypothetical protein